MHLHRFLFVAAWLAVLATIVTARGIENSAGEVLSSEERLEFTLEAGEEPGTLRFAAKNMHSKPITIDKRHTPLTGVVDGDYFVVNDGEVPYAGVDAVLGEATTGDVQTLNPGETASALVSLSDAFNIPKGEHTVTLSVRIPEVREVTEQEKDYFGWTNQYTVLGYHTAYGGPVKISLPEAIELRLGAPSSQDSSKDKFVDEIADRLKEVKPKKSVASSLVETLSGALQEQSVQAPTWHASCTGLGAFHVTMQTAYTKAMAVMQSALTWMEGEGCYSHSLVQDHFGDPNWPRYVKIKQIIKDARANLDTTTIKCQPDKNNAAGAIINAASGCRVTWDVGTGTATGGVLAYVTRNTGNVMNLCQTVLDVVGATTKWSTLAHEATHIRNPAGPLPVSYDVEYDRATLRTLMWKWPTGTAINARSIENFLIAGDAAGWPACNKPAGGCGPKGTSTKLNTIGDKRTCLAAGCVWCGANAIMDRCRWNPWNIACGQSHLDQF